MWACTHAMFLSDHGHSLFSVKGLSVYDSQINILPLQMLVSRSIEQFMHQPFINVPIISTSCNCSIKYMQIKYMTCNLVCATLDCTNVCPCYPFHHTFISTGKPLKISKSSYFFLLLAVMSGISLENHALTDCTIYNITVHASQCSLLQLWFIIKQLW